jgi:hypothetical protein
MLARGDGALDDASEDLGRPAVKDGLAGRLIDARRRRVRFGAVGRHHAKLRAGYLVTGPRCCWAVGGHLVAIPPVLAFERSPRIRGVPTAIPTGRPTVSKISRGNSRRPLAVGKGYLPVGEPLPTAKPRRAPAETGQIPRRAPLPTDKRATPTWNPGLYLPLATRTACRAGDLPTVSTSGRTCNCVYFRFGCERWIRAVAGRADRCGWSSLCWAGKSSCVVGESGRRSVPWVRMDG